MILREKKKRVGVYSVLIISEGQNTEPAYLEGFEKYLNLNFSHLYPDGIKFTIYPYGPDAIVNIQTEEQQFTRKKIEKTFLNFESKINEDIEDEYTPAPTRWVRYAQKQGKCAGFNQVWSFFDYDNRADLEIQRAFDLAENKDGNEEFVVKIAFSSYSFEHWLLLHYELNNTYISGSECKDIKKNEINCGIVGNTNPLNCFGKNCIGGYLRIKNYEVGKFNKTKQSTFPSLEKIMNKARYNASYLRDLPFNKGKNIWEIKPVTNVDVFIDALISDNKKISWHFENGTMLFPDFKILWHFVSRDIIKIIICKINNSTLLINKGNISLLDEEYSEVRINNKILMDTENEYCLDEIDISKASIRPKFISIEINHTIHISNLF